ncbi:MAG: hypothetical protein ACM3JJ_07450 [Hyphomicrobiales bacterium]
MIQSTPDQFSTLFRFGMPAVFVALAVVAIAQQGKRRAKLESAWRGLADETGGAYSREKMTIRNNEWIGGPTVRWTIRDVPVSLLWHRQGKNSTGTRLRAPLRLSRPFQFHVMTQSALARFATSPKLWNVILTNAEKEAEKKAEGAGASVESARDAIRKLRFMASEPVKTGDPLFDESFLLKTDDPERARDVLFSSGVSYWMHELQRVEKGWSCSLASADLNGGYGITVELQGMVSNPESLRAARSLVEAVIGRLADQNAIASTKTSAA